MQTSFYRRFGLAQILLLATLSAIAQLPANRPQPQSGPFATPLTDSAIDNGAFAEWAEGAEHPLTDPALARQMLWTQTTPANGGSFKFGNSTQPGPRHLRIGFKTPLAFGSVLVRAGGQLSVLKPGAAYPGNLAEESQWIPAQRVTGGNTVTADVDQSTYALWILPPGTSTRALRFSHNAPVTDPSYAGVLGGIYLLPDRFANLAPQATVVTSANSASAPLLVDGKYNNWGPWDNGPAYHHSVTAQTPEWIILTWPKAVPIRGLAALWGGFNAADTQLFTGPDSVHPQDAPEADWQPIGPPYTLRNQYPRGLGVDWFDFGKTVTTRAVRLRITAVTDESHHAHLAGKTHDGSRVWLGELMALSPLGPNPLPPPIIQSPQAAAIKASSGPAGISNQPDAPHGPIAIPFTLSTPGFVTLVVEDAKGNRVRNLLSDTWFEAGKNTAWWDGADDLGRDPDAASHGVYRIPTHFVAPGTYSVRGLVHKQIDLRYEFSVYNAGHPAWDTPDTKGGWLTNHAPPSAALFVPAEKAPGGKPLVYLGSYISEGGSGLAWVDLEGKKQGGRGWIGGAWTGAPFLARDAGAHATPGVYAYVCSSWSDDAHKDPKHPLGVIRLTALTEHGDKSVLNHPLDPQGTLTYHANGKAAWGDQTGGLAIHDNLIVVGLPLINQLLFVDASSGKVQGTASVPSPHGIAFDAKGRLLVLSGTQLLRYPALAPAAQFQPSELGKSEQAINSGLEEPVGITLDDAGNLYISDRGNSHQVKVFTDAGKLIRTIGHPGKPQAGAYDQQHMNNPRGMAIDSDHHLWVTEEDFQPKRVSVWTLDGKFLKAFYGPSQYGGGGVLDAQDKSRFYYDGMQFHLDWAAGKDTLQSIYMRVGEDNPLPPINGMPETALAYQGHRYFTNSYTGNGTRGVDIATLYLDVDGVARPVAALGKANAWDVLKTAPFQPNWPHGVDLKSNSADNSTIFAWSDLNGDGKVDPDEVVFQKAVTGWITVMPDLAIVDASVDGKAMRYPPVRTTAQGAPVYDLAHGQVIADGAQKPLADGDGQALYSNGLTVLTTAPSPFPRSSFGGVDAQGHRWSYPNLWPGLHPSHSAPIADRPGEVISSTRLLGGFITPPGSNAGPVWGINGNFGELYLFTADGLFLTRLFQDERTGRPWTMPLAQRDMLLNDVSLYGENFFPSMTQTPDGKVYLVDGRRTSIVRVDGLDGTRLIPATPVEVTVEAIKLAHLNLQKAEALRQDTAGANSLVVPIGSEAPTLESLVNEKANESSDNWATVDRRTTTVYWNHKPDVVEASIRIAAGKLFVSYRSSDPKLLVNSGTVENAPFKTGGALDLMIGTNPQADPKRESPVEGDLRLLVYLVGGKPRAMLYRAVVPGAKSPVPFSSPDRTITLDEVTDVTSQLQFAVNQGNYAFSIPLITLGLKPMPGQTVKADIGILRGDGSKTVQRVYWNNKATGITEDVPSEAELTPSLWGEWVFKQQ